MSPLGDENPEADALTSDTYLRSLPVLALWLLAKGCPLLSNASSTASLTVLDRAAVITPDDRVYRRTRVSFETTNEVPAGCMSTSVTIPAVPDAMLSTRAFVERLNVISVLPPAVALSNPTTMCVALTATPDGVPELDPS